MASMRIGYPKPRFPLLRERNTRIDQNAIRDEDMSMAPAFTALPPELRAPITDRASGEAWIRSLKEADLDFHFEDDPASIIYIRTGEPIFAEEDVPLIRERISALYALDWGEHDCPIGFLLSLDPPDLLEGDATSLKENP